MGKCKAFAQMMALSGLLLALPTEEALPYNMSRDAIYAFSILRECRLNPKPLKRDAIYAFSILRECRLNPKPLNAIYAFSILRECRLNPKPLNLKL